MGGVGGTGVNFVALEVGIGQSSPRGGMAIAGSKELNGRNGPQKSCLPRRGILSFMLLKRPNSTG